MKQSLVRNLAIGFGLSLILLLGSSVAAYLSIQNLLHSSEWVNHTYRVINELENVVAPIKDAESAQRGFLITNDPLYLDPFEGSFQQSLLALERVKQMTADNPLEQERCDQLKDLINRRYARMEALIEAKKNTNLVDTRQLAAGNDFMDSIRAVTRSMKNTELELLGKRTGQQDTFSRTTPLIIVGASIVSVLVALVFFIRVRRDIDEKARLQSALEKRDQDISRRIDIIRRIAEKISAGDYKIRINDEEKDDLGSLATSLNVMASSLESSFSTISDKEWIQSGSARLAELIMGEHSLWELAHAALDEMVAYTQSAVGAFYFASEKNTLNYSAGFAFDPTANQRQIEFGQGIVGECAQNKREIELSELTRDDLQISYATGNIKPLSIYVFPVLFEKNLLAVVEIGSLCRYGEREKIYLKNAADRIGVAVNTTLSRIRLQELLEETQAQAEELQTQHNELETINEEMEAQTEKLRASEEELKVQQEELMQTNRELEERSRLLEEKNELIAYRNSEIQKKADELAQSTRYKSEFLANMSHELRTPLNSILLLSRLLTENKEQNLTKEQVDYARVIQTSGSGLLELIDEILDLSKIEAGRMQPEYGLVDVDVFAAGMQSLFEPLAKEKKLDFMVNMDAAVPKQVETDRMRVEQILKNLLSNAFKFTSQGSVTLEIKPDPADPLFLLFSVEDTGIGIPEDKQGLIFGAFQQADGSTKRRFGGTGLGLSISLELSRLLNGDLFVSSEEGKGSIFTLRIPVNRQLIPLTAGRTGQPVSGENAEQNDPFQSPGREKLTAPIIPEDIPDDRDFITPEDRLILIIEDDTRFAKAVLDFARNHGYKCIVAVRGDTGIQLARTYNPRGILLDIQLPVKNGWEVMEELKRDPVTRHIPVHVMSSFEARRESQIKGAVDFISKPVAFDQMPEVFRKIELARKSSVSSKVLILEENAKHAQALSYFLTSNGVQPKITASIRESIAILKHNEAECVILEPADTAFDYKELQ
ncbi:MAG TPA: CHASE3 domain-containing protein, partial [Puia sp.]|nr:CHASE3 domain-containing protein [Puia sp.]